MRLSFSTSDVRAASVWFVRSAKFWLGLLSTMTAATEGIGSRSSRVKDGLASASTIMPIAMARMSAPRLRATSSRMEISTAAPKALHTT